MRKWMKENKKKIIGFLATITTTILLIVINKILLLLNPNVISSFTENNEVGNVLMYVAFAELLIIFLTGVSAIYFVFIALHFIFYTLKNKVVARVGE